MQKCETLPDILEASSVGDAEADKEHISAGVVDDRPNSVVIGLTLRFNQRDSVRDSAGKRKWMDPNNHMSSYLLTPLTSKSFKIVRSPSPRYIVVGRFSL